MRYWERGTAVYGGVYRIRHLVHVAILAPHWGGVLTNPLFRWYAFHPGGIFFLQRKALGLHWDLNPAIFSTTHTHNFSFPIYVCLTKKNFKEDPTLHGNWGSRRAEVQSLDLTYDKNYGWCSGEQGAYTSNHKRPKKALGTSKDKNSWG